MTRGKYRSSAILRLLFLFFVRLLLGLRLFILHVIADDSLEWAERECRTFLAAGDYGDWA